MKRSLIMLVITLVLLAIMILIGVSFLTVSLAP